MGGLRLAALLGRFGLSAVIFEETRIRHRGFKPVEELGGRIDLVVMLAIGEDRHLVQVFGTGCILRDGDKPILDHRGLRVHPHDLLAVWLVPGHTMATVGDQFLDQLSARGLVLNQNFGGVVEVLLALSRQLYRARVKSQGSP
jgi:hypothetical protein